ncbi:MAG: hypothetical protein QOD00_806 [Blastocatellia bacterium]|jgi:hypothetical protein|nr:hypothetical protein [Blastocatellia bacterium]
MTSHADTNKEPVRASRRSVKIALILFGLFIGFAIAEAGLRIIGYTYPVFYTTDHARGYALRPGMAGWYRKENDVYVRINSDGLRDREHSRTKNADTLRIALLGDSYAEALQVPQEDAFWEVMRRKLESCGALTGGRKVEVINFGVSGYGTAQELITLREKVWDYSPDIVMLAVTTNNDISDNLRALKKTDEIPYFVFADGHLALDDSFLQTRSFRLRESALSRLGAWIRDSSRVIQAFHQAHHAFKNYLASRRARNEKPAPAPSPAEAQAQPQTQSQTQNAPGDAAADEELGTDNLIYREPKDAVWNDAWRVSEALLTQMRDEIRNHGAKFVVVTLSNGIQVFPEPHGRQAFMQRLGVEDLFYPERRISSLGERESIPVITLAPALQTYAEQHKVFLHGFGKELGNGHWNTLGHKVAGEMLADKLCEATTD